MAGGFRLGCTNRRNRVARNAKEAMLAVCLGLFWKAKEVDYLFVSCGSSVTRGESKNEAPCASNAAGTMANLSLRVAAPNPSTTFLIPCPN